MRFLFFDHLSYPVLKSTNSFTHADSIHGRGTTVVNLTITAFTARNSLQTEATWLFITDQLAVMHHKHEALQVILLLELGSDFARTCE